jgi:hypothetical protein
MRKDHRPESGIVIAGVYPIDGCDFLRVKGSFAAICASGEVIHGRPPDKQRLQTGCVCDQVSDVPSMDCRLFFAELCVPAQTQQGQGITGDYTLRFCPSRREV